MKKSVKFSPEVQERSVRIADIDTLRCEVAAWQAHRDQLNARIDWQFTTDSAHVKLK